MKSESVKPCPFCGKQALSSMGESWCPDCDHIMLNDMVWDEAYCWKEISKLTQTLATERDAFGKRETELMRANRIYREALEKIQKHCHGDSIVYARVALQVRPEGLSAQGKA